MTRSRRTNQATSLTEMAELLRLLGEALEACEHADGRAVLTMALVGGYPESGEATRAQARERAETIFAAISPVITAPLDRNALRFITEPAIATAMNPEVLSVLATDNSLVSEFVNPNSISAYEIYVECAGMSENWRQQ